jgi:hypothetical protein
MKERIIIRDQRFYDHMLKRDNVHASALYKDARAVVTRDRGYLFCCAVEQIRVELEPHNIGMEPFRYVSFFNKSI